MADQKINALPTKTSPTTGDKMLMIGAAEEYQIDYDQLADAILNKLTSKTYSLDQGTKSLLAALNELNSKTFQESNEIITSDVDWNTINEAGVYKVQCGNGFAEGKNTPMITSISDFYHFGILLVFKPVVDNENRLIQIYIPDIQPAQPYRARIAIRSFNSSFRMWGMIKVENTL